MKFLGVKGCLFDYRACRLKKKAGHEANKIKLFGLNQENSEYRLSHTLFSIFTFLGHFAKVLDKVTSR